MEMVIDKNVELAIAPDFRDIGLEKLLLNKCIISSGLVVFGSAKEDRSEVTMSSVVRYILENDTFIKGNLTYIGKPEFSFDEIKSLHSIVMLHSDVSVEKDFEKLNKSMMRRSADLVVFNNTSDSSKAIEEMVDLGLTGTCVFGQVEASSIVQVLDLIRSKYPLEKQASEVWDFIEVTKIVICQRIVEDIEGKRFAVWEYLSIDKQVKELLIEALKSAEGIEGVIRVIKEIVSNDAFDSKGFKSQADELLKDGTINEDAYKKLIRVDM